MTDKCAFCNNTLLPKEEINKRIYGKPVCNSAICIDKANLEAKEAVDAAMSPRDKVISYLAREGFKEQGMTKGLFILDGETQIAVNMNKLSDEFSGAPVVGVYTGGNILESGHGVNRLESVIVSHRQNIISILKSKPAQKAKEQPAPKIEDAELVKNATSVPAPIAKPQPKPAEVVAPEKVEHKGEVKKMEEKKEEKALAIKEPEVTLSIDVIKQYICPTATDAEAFNFLQLCHYRQLNPFLKEAYLIKYGNTTSMVVGKDAFTRKAEESPAFDGYEAGIVLISDGKFEERVGTILKPKEELVGGWAKVYRKNTAKPFEVRVSLAEYDKKMNNWKSMPATMIRKVALVQALREAFTKELGGCYDATEIDPDAVIVEEKKQ